MITIKSKLIESTKKKKKLTNTGRSGHPGNETSNAMLLSCLSWPVGVNTVPGITSCASFVQITLMNELDTYTDRLIKSWITESID